MVTTYYTKLVNNVLIGIVLKMLLTVMTITKIMKIMSSLLQWQIIRSSNHLRLIILNTTHLVITIIIIRRRKTTIITVAVIVIKSIIHHNIHQRISYRHIQIWAQCKTKSSLMTCVEVITTVVLVIPKAVSSLTR